MSLDPLFAAPLVIQVHAFAAMTAFVAGIVQLAGPKGILAHRVLGYSWVAAMLVIAGTSFWIRDLRDGAFSPIHLLSMVTLILVPLAVMAARRGKVKRHGYAMTALFAGAVVIAGAFTFLPGRIMHAVVF